MILLNWIKHKFKHAPYHNQVDMACSVRNEVALWVKNPSRQISPHAVDFLVDCAKAEAQHIVDSQRAIEEYNNFRHRCDF